MRDVSNGLPPDYTEEEFRAYSMRVYEREQEAQRPTVASDMAENTRDAAYDKIDRYLRNNLDDSDYAEFSEALEAVYATPTREAAPAAASEDELMEREAQGAILRWGYGRFADKLAAVASDSTGGPWNEAAPAAVAREFTNELGNRIRITIEGPTSTSENILTPLEAQELRAALATPGAERAAPALQQGLHAMQLHAAILNLPCNNPLGNADTYAQGHRDARHAAASLVASSPAAGGAPLSDERVRQAVGANDHYWATSKLWILSVARAIEAAHGISDASEQGGGA
jgi:hypothetical protein